ncbi:hypothetical protein LUZ60_007030 [Juncus effusus]|nr:hypothetical protein LUZ60_007030 [Juncus effusus]
MDLPQETEEYIRESIESSLGLQISAKNIQMKLIASEDARHRLQDQVFLLEERLQDAVRRVDQYKAEASMNALGLRKCVEEKGIMASKYDQLNTRRVKLERECALYERDLEKLMESLDEVAKENEDLRAKFQNTEVAELTHKIETLEKEKEIARINLNKAEEEVKVLIEDNRILDEENKMLRAQLQRSAKKKSASASATGKRKSRSLIEGSPTGVRAIDFGAVADLFRQPLSPLQVNSPMHKK